MGRLLAIAVLCLFLIGGYFMLFDSPLEQTNKYINDQVMEIQKKGKLIVATDATYPPLEFLNEKKEIVGFDIDLAREIAKDMGVEMVIRNLPFDEVFSALKTGEVDMIISSVTITTERQKEVLFSAPYFNAGQVIVVKKGSEIKDGTQLSGKKAGVQKGTTSHDQARELTDDNLVTIYSDYDGAKKDLLEGSIDFIVVDYPAGVSMGKESKGELVVIGNPFTSEFYGVVVSKGKEGLVEAVNRTLSRLKTDGGLAELENLWF